MHTIHVLLTLSCIYPSEEPIDVLFSLNMEISIYYRFLEKCVKYYCSLSTNVSIREVMRLRINRKTAKRSCSVPVAILGSGKLQCTCCRAFGKTGHASAASSQTVTTRSMGD